MYGCKPPYIQFLTKIRKRRQPLFLAQSRNAEQGEFVEADAFGHGKLARQFPLILCHAELVMNPLPFGFALVTTEREFLILVLRIFSKGGESSIFRFRH